MAQQLRDVLASIEKESVAVASIARDNPSTFTGDDPSPLPGMHRDHNAR